MNIKQVSDNTVNKTEKLFPINTDTITIAVTVSINEKRCLKTEAMYEESQRVVL